MKIASSKYRLPALVCAGSFLLLGFLLTATSPVNQIGYAMAFFAVFLIFLISLGYLITKWQFGKVSPAARRRVVIVSVSISMLLMFRSAQSLNWVDLIILLLVTGGLLFYSNRRAL